MDAGAQNELYQIKRELQSIITELDNIAAGIRRDFTGIGNEQCASCVSRVSAQYRTVKSKLDHMDLSKVTEAYAQAHSSGGGRKA